MRPLIVVTILLSAHAFAQPAAPDAEPRALLDAWLAAQNGGDFEAYQKLYAASFAGVRRSGKKAVNLDRAGWIADRERMFKSKMEVSAEAVEIEPRTAGALVRFRQTWASGRYKDTGTKELELVREDGALRIAREEMLDSRKDLGIRGAGLLVWAAGKPDETAAALETAERLSTALFVAVNFPRGFPTGLEGNVDGVRPGESVVALGVCTPAELAAMYELFRALGPRVQVRETSWRPRADGSSCPGFDKNAETGGGWGWDGRVGTATPRGATLTVAVLHRDDHELGDFAREYSENLFVAVLRKKDGTTEVQSFKGSGDFAEVLRLEDAGGAVEAVERFVDAPCNGGDRHRFQIFERTVRFEMSNDDIAQRELRKKVLERGRCSDEEARQMQRGNQR